MSSAHVQISPDSTGKDIDAQSLTSTEAGTPTVFRQTVTLGDGTTYGNIAKVDASGNVATAVPDGANAAQGTTTDTSSANTVIGLLKALKALLTGTLTTSVSNFPGTQPVSGTVTANAGSGTLATSVADGQNATIGTTTDVSSASTLVGLLKNIKAALAGTLTTSVSNFPGTQPVSGAVSVSNLPVTQSVSQKGQTSVTVTLQSAATATGNGSIATTDGYNGALQLLISNGAGTCTVTVEGSLDNFVTAQDVVALGVYKLSDSGAGTNVSRAILSGALSVAANTSYLYAVADTYPYMRARISSAASLGAGTNVTGCTAKLYGVPA